MVLQVFESTWQLCREVVVATCMLIQFFFVILYHFLYFSRGDASYFSDNLRMNGRFINKKLTFYI